MRMRGGHRTWMLIGLFLLAVGATVSAADDAELDGPLPTPPNVDDLIPADEAPATPADPEPAPAPAPAVTPAARTETTPPALQRGRTTIGVVTAGSVNLRSGPGGNDEYEIITTVKRGTELKIVGERDDWYCVRYPEGQACWISVEAVDGDIPDAIDSEGVAVPVKGETVQIRVRSWDRATVVGSIEGGDIVTVVGRRGQWYKILAPEAACAWISAKYVKLVEAVELPSAPVPEPGALPSTDAADAGDGEGEAAEDDDADADERRSEIAELIQKRYAPQEEDPEAIRKQQEAAREAMMDEVEAELARIRAETQARKRAIAMQFGGASTDVDVQPKPRPADPSGTSFTGWVEFYGYGVGRPAAFRLVKGGDVVYLLRSSVYNLEDFTNKYVAVDGIVEPAPGFEANVLLVQELTVLDEGPFADPAVGGSGEENVPYRPAPGGDVEGAAGGEVFSPPMEFDTPADTDPDEPEVNAPPLDEDTAATTEGAAGGIVITPEPLPETDGQ